jgi:hypothetical protein
LKESTRKAREQRKHDETLALLLGITYEEVLANREKEDADDKLRQVQAIHLFLEKPEAFITKKCDECQGLFLTSYKFVSSCSSVCRIKSLERKGIIWNPMHTGQDRWLRAQIPVEYSIPPEALKVLLQLAEEQHSLSSEHSEFHEPSEEFQNTEQSHNDAPKSPVSELPASILELDEDYLL